jgi:hypothetical protein
MPYDLEQLRDHAWKHFTIHADQRPCKGVIHQLDDSARLSRESSDHQNKSARIIRRFPAVADRKEFLLRARHTGCLQYPRQFADCRFLEAPR